MIKAQKWLIVKGQKRLSYKAQNRLDYTSLEVARLKFLKQLGCEKCEVSGECKCKKWLEEAMGMKKIKSGQGVNVKGQKG